MKTVLRSLVVLLLFILSACGHAAPLSGGGPGGELGERWGAPKAFTKPISFSVLQDYPKGEDLREVAWDFELIKELGAATWRGSFSWIDFEPERGRYDLAWLHRFLELSSRQGMALRPYLGYTPAWAAKGGTDREVWNDPPKRLEDWRDFVSTMVRELRPYRNVLSYEIYNEENTRQWWDGTAGDYNAVLRSASDTVRSLAPGTPVLLGGMVWPDTRWIEAACVTYGNAARFDVVPIHAYPETWTPANITVENYLDQGHPGFFEKQFVPFVDSRCSRRPIWINEAGFATPPGKTELDQANWWARAFATFLADPRIEHLGIYQVRDRQRSSAVIGESENYFLGLTYPDRKKKLAFFTVKRLIDLLNVGHLTVADAELVVQITGGVRGQLYHHLLVRPDGRQVLFVWDKKGSPTLKITARKATTATEYALNGTAMPYPAYDGRSLSEVRLTPGMVRIFELR